MFDPIFFSFDIDLDAPLRATLTCGGKRTYGVERWMLEHTCGHRARLFIAIDGVMRYLMMYYSCERLAT